MNITLKKHLVKCGLCFCVYMMGLCGSVLTHKPVPVVLNASPSKCNYTLKQHAEPTFLSGDPLVKKIKRILVKKIRRPASQKIRKHVSHVIRRCMRNKMGRIVTKSEKLLVRNSEEQLFRKSEDM